MSDYASELQRLQTGISDAIAENPDKKELLAHSLHIKAGSIADYDAPDSQVRMMWNTCTDYEEGEPRKVPIIDGNPYRMGLTFEVSNEFDEDAFDTMAETLYAEVKDEQSDGLGGLVNRTAAHFLRPNLSRQYVVASDEYNPLGVQLVEEPDTSYILLGQADGPENYQATFEEAERIAQFLDNWSEK